mmetsp:Transcript_22685/g.45403  ORF Transcript_22685/g.45403 Transcript_22685/m.45403 type:complete len:91 (+) Transcript_22685:324-596(+)
MGRQVTDGGTTAYERVVAEAAEERLYQQAPSLSHEHLVVRAHYASTEPRSCEGGRSETRRHGRTRRSRLRADIITLCLINMTVRRWCRSN